MRFYFFIAPHEVYNDAAVYLAEGLHEIGVPFCANRDFWQLEPDGDWLFHHDPAIAPADCDVLVITSYWFNYIDPATFQATGLPMPKELAASGRRRQLVLLDPDDGYKTTGWRPEFRAFDLVLRPKYNRRTFNHANTVPWVLGFGSRVLRATASAPPFPERRRAIIQNFGYTHGYVHGTRRVALDRLLTRLAKDWLIDTRQTGSAEPPPNPWDRLMWQQSQQKHNPAYYQQIREAQIVACFCGDFIPGFPFDPSPGLAGGSKARLKFAFYRLCARALYTPDRIIQWDSWRFWECLAAGSVAMHVDLEKYGALLPVMPVNWKHYIGFDFDHLDHDVRRFLSLDAAALARIATAGHQWALEHYAPPSAARRCLELLQLASPTHA